MQVDYTKEDLVNWEKEHFLMMDKMDFNCHLKNIKKEDFEKAFFKSLDGYIQRAKKNITMDEMSQKYIYIYYYPKRERKIQAVAKENIAAIDFLICKEKLSAFYLDSDIERAAFYEARILKPIRERHAVRS